MPNLETHAKDLTTTIFNLFAALDEKSTLQQAYKDILFHKNEGTLDLFLSNPRLDEKLTGLQKTSSVFTFLAESNKEKHAEKLTNLLSQDYVLDAFKAQKSFYEPTNWLVKNLNEDQVNRVLSAQNAIWNTYDKNEFKDHIDLIKGFNESDKDCVLVTAYLDPKHICYALEKMRITPTTEKIDCDMA